MDEINTPLITIPGIGYTLATTIISEIGDINRFSKPWKLVAFECLNSSVYQSGKYNATQTMMAYFASCKIVAMRDKTFKNYLNKKLSEGKHCFFDLYHVGKKLIRFIFHLLKNNISFVPQA